MTVPPGPGAAVPGRPTGHPAALRAGRRTPEILGLLGAVLIALLLRFPGLATRGPWDADQGNDMLALRAFVRDGVVPLLGPPTSIGAFHHGALYYYLLAPAAALGGGDDPLPVVAAIALAGTVAVVATWWLARAIGGPLAGFVAGLLLAVSATSVASSTFIWNPNLAVLSGVVALAAAWQAWATRRPAWWLVAAGGLTVTMQAHVLGIALVLPLAALYVADLRRRRGDRRGLVRWGLAGLGLVALGCVPLLVHEIGHDFSETRAALEFLRSGGEPVALDPLSRLVFVALRIVAWPLAGLITDAPVPAILAVLAVLAGVIWRIAATRGQGAAGGAEPAAVRWLAGSLVAVVVALALSVGSLARVTPLPVDHYHAFVDPLVVVLAGLVVAALWRQDGGGRVLAAGGLAALVAWNLATQPPAIAPDGGWPAARAAADRLLADAAGRPLALVGLPTFKATTAYGYPLTVDGRAPVPAEEAGALAVLCDDLFVEYIGAACGGSAEDREVARLGVAGTLVERFSPAPGRTLSVYLVGPP